MSIYIYIYSLAICLCISTYIYIYICIRTIYLECMYIYIYTCTYTYICIYLNGTYVCVNVYRYRKISQVDLKLVLMGVCGISPPATISTNDQKLCRSVTKSPVGLIFFKAELRFTHTG